MSQLNYMIVTNTIKVGYAYKMVIYTMDGWGREVLFNLAVDSSIAYQYDMSVFEVMTAKIAKA